MVTTSFHELFCFYFNIYDPERLTDKDCHIFSMDKIYNIFTRYSEMPLSYFWQKKKKKKAKEKKIPNYKSLMHFELKLHKINVKITYGK